MNGEVLMSSEKLLILDGNSLMNRAYYALPLLTNKDGVHTNAVYGFTTMLLKMKQEIMPDFIVCTFDRKAPTFRHDEYKEYKAGRKKMPPELAEQFPIVKELLSLFSIDIYEIDGFEADDLIGTLSVFAEKKDIEVYIVTGDKDHLQLATDKVKVIINKKGMTETEVYDRERMSTEFGITPKQFIDVKGLMGDTSDNIPGVPGIGEKTAFKLITQYSSIENVLMHIDDISGKKIKENLMEYSEQAIFSKKLATIMTDVPIDIDLDSIKSKESFDVNGIKEMFYKLQFKSLLDKIPEVKIYEDENRVEVKADFVIIETVNDFRKLVQGIKIELFVDFKIIDANIYSKCDLVKIYLNTEGKNYIVNLENLYNEDEKVAIDILRSIFENDDIKKIGFDFKPAYTVLKKHNILIKSLCFDIKIAAYLIDPSRGNYDIKELINEYLNIDISGEGDELNINEVSILPKLYEIFNNDIENVNMGNLLNNVELPLIEVLSSMESEGICVDRVKLEELGIKFKGEIEKTQSEIFELAGEKFNVSSPKQLGKILFEKLDLPAWKKIKTGYSTNAEVLEGLLDKHPIIEKIIYYRQLTKLFSTYVEGLKAVIDVDGKIHSSFNQTVTVTGRLSSTEPNLQNIPIKYELGREIRKVFIPNDKESIILSADYSQIELRILAHIADDENMISAFKNHNDIHTKTASEVFKVPLDEVTSIMRSRAKAVNFGIVYGIGDFSLAKDIHVSKAEAKTYIETYFERYPKVKKYLEDIVIKAEKDSYVTTILNRRRFIPEIKSSNKIVKAFGDRLAMNSPIQGSAADVIKLAMIHVYEKLKEYNLKSTLILQVHDELILNVTKDEVEKVKEIVKNEMENVFELLVPLEVDINIGNNWYEAK